MRAVFGVVSLVIVLAVVGFSLTRQLKATGQVANASKSQFGLPATAAASGTVRQQTEQLQQQIANDVDKALEQGAARNAGADQ